MFEKIHKLFDRVESRIALWQIFQGGAILSVGGVTGWLSVGVDWINQYGAFGWWSAALTGSLVATTIVLGMVSIRYTWGKSKAINKWKNIVDSIDPMADTFGKKRISIAEIVDPISRSIAKKTFTDCDLIGPANLFFQGQCSLNGVAFIDCDMVPLKRSVRLLNVVPISEINMVRGRIYNCTIFIPPGMEQTFRNMGVGFTSIATDEVSEPLPPQGIEPEKQR